MAFVVLYTANSFMCAARGLTLEAAQSAASNRGTSTDATSRSNTAVHIKKLLDSRNDREVLDGMRKVISVWSVEYLPSFE